MSGDCPPGVPELSCYIDPCADATCRKYPAATCRPNFCGGCNAEFFVNDIKLDCACDQPIVNCVLDPCMFATCDEYPTATCISNYCGNCNADFYVNGDKVNC